MALEPRKMNGHTVLAGCLVYHFLYVSLLAAIFLDLLRASSSASLLSRQCFLFRLCSLAVPCSSFSRLEIYRFCLIVKDNRAIPY